MNPNFTFFLGIIHCRQCFFGGQLDEFQICCQFIHHPRCFVRLEFHAQSPACQCGENFTQSMDTGY